MIDNDSDNDSEEEILHLHPVSLVFSGATAEDAKVFVQQNLQQGVTCPTCGQFCKVYRRKLNATMALALILIYQFFKNNPHAEWLHVAAFLVKVKRDSSIAGGDVVKLRYWGLLERAKGERDDGSDRVGRYRITELGRQFVEGKVKVASHVLLYNQMLLGVSSEMISIREALGTRFRYDELMRA
ncbi:MAG: hypothetical protein Q6370_010790 [Candidatus Sigynarchaeota archaeon]|jgi:hypothetical protein